MQLSVEEVGRLLEPWLGAGMKLSELPIPVVFEVSLKPAAQQMDYEPLRRELQAIDETIELDSHELWVAAFAKFSTAMRGMTVALSLLILGGMGLVVSFSSRAALKLHARTVALLHSIGAEDSYVTRLFQKEALRQVLPGAFFGCIVAGGAYAIAGAYMATLNIATLPKLNFGTSHVALMLVMPAACGLVAWVVAQISVTRQLERTL
jgi:cell division transport system permease protein